ncbi:MAG: flagellin hook IN motif-containing protein [Thermodesulfobacteriota bacterium]
MGSSLAIGALDALSGLISARWYVANLSSRTLSTSYSSSITVNQQLAALNGLYAQAYNTAATAAALSQDSALSASYGVPTQSSDHDVVSILYNDTSYHPDDASSSVFHFAVQQLALKQINNGASLNAAAATAIDVGTNAFTLTVGGTGYSLEITIDAGDSNEVALNKLAQAINAAGSGVTATLVYGDEGTVYLNLAGPYGAAHAFSLADVTGNAVSATGADTKTQSAQDADFLVNGLPYTQENNTVSLLAGHLQVNLQGTGRATVTLGSETMVDMVKSLLNGMNSFTAYLGSTSDLNSGLSQAWSSLVNTYSHILTKYGLQSVSGGQLGLDTLVLTDALKSHGATVREAFYGSGGLAPAVQAFMQEILTSPGAALLSSPPTSSYAATYLNSRASAPWYRLASSSFLQVV